MKTLCLAGLTVALLATGASAASLVVVEARGIALKPGTMLDAAKPLTLKQGQHVTLISQTGSTLRLDGPYDRPPAAGGDQGRSVAATLAAFTTERKARLGEAGVTRGTVVAALPDPWVIDATHSGHGCLRENHMPVFWRPESKGVASLVVTPVDRSWRAQTSWPAGQDRITVTTDVPMRNGDTYVVTFNGSEYAVAMTLVPAALENDDMRAAWMANKGCEAQAQVLAQAQTQASAKPGK